jgi:hypothetical protein
MVVLYPPSGGSLRSATAHRHVVDDRNQYKENVMKKTQNSPQQAQLSLTRRTVKDLTVRSGMQPGLICNPTCGATSFAEIRKD